MAKAKGKRKDEARKAPWRENIETLTGAIILALLFKAFVIEISRIPSPSMQPTLMGKPEIGLSDRILVDKLSFAYRDPDRWEIVVFKHPLERSRNMVKRVVGLPEEEIRIEHGDVWVRPHGEDDWRIPRRARLVQEGRGKAVDRAEPSVSSWRARDGAAAWRLVGREIEANGDGIVRFLPDRSAIHNGFLDGYPEILRGARRQGGSPLEVRQVGDLRIATEVEARAGSREIVARLCEGDALYVFRLPGPAADAGARPTIEHWSASAFFSGNATEPLETSVGEPFRLDAGDGVDFAAQNLDDLLSLEIDGEFVCELEVPSQSDVGTWAELGQTGDGATLSGVMLYRDVYYTQGRMRGDAVDIVAGHYFMLGDNTQESADSREWISVAYEETTEDGGVSVRRGNYRPRENPRDGKGRDGETVEFFRDEWGERRPVSRDGRLAEESHPLVPAHLITGRAVAVFWPVKPWKDIWRLSWLN